MAKPGNKRAEGWFNICFGVVFLAWTACDVYFEFFEEYWYANVFFALIGALFIVYGIHQLRASRHSDDDGPS